MEENHFIAAVAQRLHRLYDDLGVLVEIRHDHHNAAAVQKILEMDKRLGEVGVGPDCAPSMACSRRKSCPCRVEGCHVILHVLVENDEPGGIALGVRHVAQRCRHEARVIQLGNPGGAESHGGGGIQQHEQLGIGFALIPLQEALVGAREDVPIDMPQIVPFRIGTILRELLGEPEIR